MPINKTVIYQLLDELKGYLYDIEHMIITGQELEDNRDLQHLLSHRLHVAVEICIDIATHIASALELPGRESAIDVIALLGKHAILTPDLAKKFQKAPKLRNLLVHGYAKVNYELLFQSLPENLAEIKDFARQIKAYLERC